MILRCVMERSGKLRSALRRELRLSDGLVRRLKPLDAFRVNGESAHTNRLLAPGDLVEVVLEEAAPDFPAQDGPLEVLYEDECLIAVDKPAGLIVHPTFSRQTGTLANYLLGHYRRTDQNCAVHVLTRLDRDTMGVVIFAKNAWAHWLLMEALDAGQVEKVYEALTVGGPAADEGLIDLPIAKRPNPSLLRYVAPGGKSAQTRFRVLERDLRPAPDGPALCRLELRPLTGRTHQLRVHCAHEGFPILGDPQYGAVAAPYCRGGSYPEGEPPARLDDGMQNAKCKTQNEAASAGAAAAPCCRGGSYPEGEPPARLDDGMQNARCKTQNEAASAGAATGRPPEATGQRLVARKITLPHPLTGERLTIVSGIKLQI